MDEKTVEKTIREYIEPLMHLSLATSRDNAPWVCEVHFACDDDLNIYFMSLPTRRHSREIADNPRVAGNIVRQFKLGDAVVGVYFEGSAKKLAPGPEQDAAFATLKQKLNIKEGALADAKRDDEHQFYKMSVDNWYVFGRFGAPSGQKYQLPWRGGKKSPQG